MRNSTYAWMSTAMVFLLVPAVQASQGNDELWEITTKVEMPGMPMQMPAQTIQSCAPKGSQQNQVGKQDMEGSCKVLESNQSGNKTTFKIVCGDDGGKSTTMAGETIHNGDSFKTTMRMTREGKRSEMTQIVTGKRIGKCDAAEQRKQMDAMVEEQHSQLESMNRNSKKAVEKDCRDKVKNLDRASLSYMKQMCGDRSRELCERVAEVESKPKTYFKLVADEQSQRNWEESARACKKDPAAIHDKACQQLVDDHDWDTLVKHCKTEATANAGQICAGRSYSSMERDSDLGELCSQYAKQDLEAGSQGDDGASSAGRAGKETARNLKKFFGF